jgi:hypothetical protein
VFIACRHHDAEMRSRKRGVVREEEERKGVGRHVVLQVCSVYCIGSNQAYVCYYC